MENRSYNLNNIPQKYQFTGKERDIESGLDGINGYDYFGARYYNSRIGKWNGVEPLIDKYPGITPYCYSSCDPIVRVDIDGLDDKYFLNGAKEPLIVPNPFPGAPDRNFIEHSQGNIIGPNLSGLNGKNFYETSSDETMEIYLKSSGEYHSSDIITDFESKEFIERFNDAIPQEGDTRSNIDYAYSESPASKRLDQKQYLSKGESGLYIFNSKANSFQEAGNIIWGAAMYHLNLPLWFAKAGAQFYSFKTYGKQDQPNEQKSIDVGYEYAEDHNFAKRAER